MHSSQTNSSENNCKGKHGHLVPANFVMSGDRLKLGAEHPSSQLEVVD